MRHVDYGCDTYRGDGWLWVVGGEVVNKDVASHVSAKPAKPADGIPFQQKIINNCYPTG